MWNLCNVLIFANYWASESRLVLKCDLCITEKGKAPLDLTGAAKGQVPSGWWTDKVSNGRGEVWTRKEK